MSNYTDSLKSFRLEDFRVGMRVQLAPHTDLWMRGMRYGTITKLGPSRRSCIMILGDNGRVYGLQPDMIGEIISTPQEGA